MQSNPPKPFFGNANEASKDTRGWFLGHFMDVGEETSLQQF